MLSTEKAAKFPAGPTSSSPGPTLLMQVITAVRGIRDLYQGVGECVRYAAFQVASIVSTTGFSSANYDLWPEFSKKHWVVWRVASGRGAPSSRTTDTALGWMMEPDGAGAAGDVPHPGAVQPERVEAVLTALLKKYHARSGSGSGSGCT